MRGDRTECAAAGAVAQVDAFAELKALDEGVLAFGAAERVDGAGGECVVFFRADVEDGGAHGSPWGAATGAGSVRVTCEIGVQRSAGARRAMLNKKGTDRKAAGAG